MNMHTTWDLRKRLLKHYPWLASGRYNPPFTVDELGQPHVVIDDLELKFMLDTC